MGRLLLLVLLVVAAVLVWKAFGPGSWKKPQRNAQPATREIKGPDDDEEFLWNLEKQAFKERRARERAAEQKQQSASPLPPHGDEGGSKRTGTTDPTSATGSSGTSDITDSTSFTDNSGTTNTGTTNNRPLDSTDANDDTSGGASGGTTEKKPGRDRQ